MCLRPHARCVAGREAGGISDASPMLPSRPRNGIVGSFRRPITTPPAPHTRGGQLDFINRTCRASCCAFYVYYISMRARDSRRMHN
jgi:hypothetical protein